MHVTSSYQIRTLPGATFGVELIPNVRAQALVTQLEHDPMISPHQVVQFEC